MVWQDIKYSVRTLLSNLGFTATAMLCLSMGIGLNGAIFSVVDGILLQPFPFTDADHIVTVDGVHKREPGYSLSWLDFCDYKEQNRTLATIAAFGGRTLTIADGTSEPARYLGAPVSSELFGLLGVRPALGRDFRPDDDRANAEPVVILSDEIWRLRYQSDPSIVSRERARAATRGARRRRCRG